MIEEEKSQEKKPKRNPSIVVREARIEPDLKTAKEGIFFRGSDEYSTRESKVEAH